MIHSLSHCHKSTKLFFRPRKMYIYIGDLFLLTRIGTFPPQSEALHSGLYWRQILLNKVNNTSLRKLFKRTNHEYVHE